jgi:hypothetical protein
MDQQDSDDVTADQQAIAAHWYMQGYLAGVAATQFPYLFTYN